MDRSSVAIVVVPTIVIIAIFAIIWRRNRGNRPWPTTLLPVCAPVRAEEQMNVSMAVLISIIKQTSKNRTMKVTTTTGRTTVFRKTPSRLSLDVSATVLCPHLIDL